MPRAATTSDPFNAIAEPKRRDIINLLANSPRQSVNDLAQHLGLPQPAVSKHLGVLRKVGLVSVEKNGQHRFYTLNPLQLKPIHAWTQTFEHFWTTHLDVIKTAAEKKARSLKNNSPNN